MGSTKPSLGGSSSLVVEVEMSAMSAAGAIFMARAELYPTRVVEIQ